MGTDGSALSKEVSEDDTKEDAEIVDGKNGNNNGKHLERYNINNSFFLIKNCLLGYHQLEVQGSQEALQQICSTVKMRLL